MSTATDRALLRELASIVGVDHVLGPPARSYAQDATRGRGLDGRPDAVALPGTAQEVAAVVGWCYAHGVAIVPRGGGTGLAGGAVPVHGGVVVALERVNRVRSFEPALWRIVVEAGVRTSDLRRRARENGLFFAPDPGAAEQSQVGGNVATNAGGPHSFKYGQTGAWVTGVEAVVAPGDLVRVGGPVRKDVAGYDLRGLLVGSEGTLGVITAAWLRLLPAPEVVLPVAAFYPAAAQGCAAIEAVLANGLVPAALEYLDAGALAAAGPGLPQPLPDGTGFLVVAEADGSATEAARVRDELVEVLGDGALGVHAPHEPAATAALWRWRDGVSLAVTARRGGKLSEDVVVPLERLAEAIDATLEIGRRHGLEACSWGHAGDGNVHATFLLDPDRPGELQAAEAAAGELFALAVALGGSVSGEHGLGWVKRGQLERQWAPRALDLHAAVKAVFDPKDLLNPGKKPARGVPAPDGPSCPS